MHEQSGTIEPELEEVAQNLTDKYDAPALVIVAGSEDGPNATRVASSFENGRLRDLLGILQTAIQIESRKHLGR